MNRIGLFYATISNTTRNVARLIKEEIGDAVECHDIAKATSADFRKYDLLILGSSTWDEKGEVDPMNQFIARLDRMDIAGKTVALFGLGDQRLYPERFANGLGTLYRELREKGAMVVGRWPSAGYEFTDSTATEGNAFVGLVLDEDNQQSLTPGRISDWVDSLRAHFQY